MLPFFLGAGNQQHTRPDVSRETDRTPPEPAASRRDTRTSRGEAENTMEDERGETVVQKPLTDTVDTNDDYQQGGQVVGMC